MTEPTDSPTPTVQPCLYIPGRHTSTLFHPPEHAHPSFPLLGLVSQDPWGVLTPTVSCPSGSRQTLPRRSSCPPFDLSHFRAVVEKGGGRRVYPTGVSSGQRRQSRTNTYFLPLTKLLGVF